MWRSTSITAYDVMGEVWIKARVYQHDGISPGAPTEVLEVSAQVRGTGEPDAGQWLRDALVALIEAAP